MKKIYGVFGKDPSTGRYDRLIAFYFSMRKAKQVYDILSRGLDGKCDYDYVLRYYSVY